MNVYLLTELVSTKRRHNSLSKVFLILCLGLFFSFTSTLQAQCPNDFDCDNVTDLLDLDDDNDGITDVEENSCGEVRQSIPADAVNNSINIPTLHDGSSTPQTITTSFPTPGCAENLESIEYRVTAFPSATSGSTNICADVDAFRSFSNAMGDNIALDKVAGCNGGMAYRIDFISGDEILDLSSLSHANMASDEAIIVRSTVPLIAITYKRPGSGNTSGSNGGPVITGNGTTEVIIDNVSTAFGGNLNVWEVSSNGVFVPYLEIEYFRSAGIEAASIEAFTLNHVSDCDNDCDGVPNRLDLDSDNDGCSDVIEVGHADLDEDGVIGSSPVEVSSDGLVLNSGGYSGTAASVTDNTIAACNPCIANPLDSDNDGICDILDLDDDNDGVLDTEENSCSGTRSSIPAEAVNNSINISALHDGSATPQMILANFPTPGCADNIENIEYRVTAFPSTASGSSTICADVDAFRSFSNAMGDNIALDKSANCNGGVSYRIDFISGDEILDLSSLSHANMAADEAIIVRSTVPLIAITYKKPGSGNTSGSNGGPMITGNGTMEVKIDNVGAAFGGNQNVWEVSSNGLFVPFLEIEYFRSSGIEAAAIEAFTLNHVSDCDNDCDGMPNRLDLDSDDDGCSDTFEAGHGDGDDDQVLGTSPVQVNEDGLVLNQNGYTGTRPELTDDNIANCDPCNLLPIDSDGDGVCDILDLDDDNDGITDVNENSCGATRLSIPADAVNNSIDIAALHDGSTTPQMITTSFPIPGCEDVNESIEYRVTASPSTASGSTTICADVDAFRSFSNAMGDNIALDKSANCNGGVSYRIDFISGDEILDLSSLSHANMASDEAIIVRSTVPLIAISFKRPGSGNTSGSNGGPMISGNGTMEVRIDNVSPAFGGNLNVWEVSSNGLFVPYLEIEYFRSSGIEGAAIEAFTLNHVSDCDNDCDGTPNRLDLDSDDDGCSDTFEAGHEDGDDDQVLGSSPVEVDENGLVLNQGGYTGNNDEVITAGMDSDNDGLADACDPCEFPELTRVSINEGSCDENDGAIYLSIADVNLPHTFEWSHGDTNEDALNLAPGTYSVTATDNTGCTTVFGPYTVIDPCVAVPCINRPQLVDVVINNATCGESGGSIDITVEGEGPFTYLWTDGIATTEDLLNPGPGIYGVIVEDVNGCNVKFYPFEIVDTDGPDLDNVSIVDGNCGAMNSAIYLSIENVNFPHTFLWSNGSTDEDLTNVDRGEYSMTLTDGTGCITEYGPFTIGPPCEIPPFIDDENENRAGLKGLVAYPNPTSSSTGLTIKYFSDTMNPELTIVNSLGMVVQTIDQDISPEWNTIEIDIKELPKGVYFIKTNDNKLESFIIN